MNVATLPAPGSAASSRCLAAGRCLAATVFVALTSACTYAAAISQTNIPSDRHHIVEAEVKKTLILFAAADNEDILQLREQLQAQCKGGRVRGILTKDLRTEYLWVLLWSRDTIATGYCIDDGNGGSP